MRSDPEFNWLTVNPSVSDPPIIHCQQIIFSIVSNTNMALVW